MVIEIGGYNVCSIKIELNLIWLFLMFWIALVRESRVVCIKGAYSESPVINIKSKK